MDNFMITKKKLKRIVLSDKQVRNIASLNYEELANLFGEDFSEMKGYSQNNPHHNLDLMQHTLAVVLGIQETCLSKEEFSDLRIAALFHDIAKPIVKQEKNDRFVYYGHAEKSMEIADVLLQEYGFTPNDIKRILFFIRFHDAFIPFKLQTEMTEYRNPHLLIVNRENVRKIIGQICLESNRVLGFNPTARDFDLLINHFCRADQNAQAETVIYQGKIIDNRSAKKKRLVHVYQHFYQEYQSGTLIRTI